MPRAYVALGSNQVDPRRQVRSALDELNHLAATRLVQHSPLYRTEPVGPDGQADYINAVAELATELEPAALLAALQQLERAHGRLRDVRWGPRTLDLDLLLYDDLQQCDPELTLPHPRMHQRLFVLQPLHDIAPELQLPGGLGAVGELLASCPPLRLEPDRASAAGATKDYRR